MESAESMGIGIEAECFFSETKTFFSNLIKFLLILEARDVVRFSNPRVLAVMWWA